MAHASTAQARPEFFTFHNGEKAPLPFSRAEYDRRLAGLREIMARDDIDATVITSMHGVAYYSGFIYCAFGRPYACVVTQDRSVTVSANIDGGQPWRRSAHENIVYTDWKRDNYWRAVKDICGEAKRVGIEGDHLTLAQNAKLSDFLGATTVDIAEATMNQRMLKSVEEAGKRSAMRSASAPVRSTWQWRAVMRWSQKSRELFRTAR